MSEATPIVRPPHARASAYPIYVTVTPSAWSRLAAALPVHHPGTGAAYIILRGNPAEVRAVQA